MKPEVKMICDHAKTCGDDFCSLRRPHTKLETCAAGVCERVKCMVCCVPVRVEAK
jgi:hypothetical protein